MKLTANHPKIEMRSLASIHPNPNNPRIHDDRQIGLLARSIERFGFVSPIIIDDEDRIVGGHAKRLAAMKLGLSEIPTLKVSFLTEADRQAFMIADNRLAELSGWDDQILAGEFESLFECGFDDPEITGFEMAEIDDFLNAGDEGEADEPAVDLPESGHEPVNRPGDLWTVGDHKLLCGDALNKCSYDRLLAGEQASLVFADPPYNVRVSDISGSGSIRHREFAQASGEMSRAEFVAFLRTAFQRMAAHSSDGSIHYICMDWRHMAELLDASEGVFTELKNLVVWVKTNAGQGSFYRSAHELVFVFKSGMKRHINNFRLGENGRYRTNVWRYPGANTFRKGRMEDLKAHPTVKPVAMVADAIRDCSKRGDPVLDPFVGSGTTLVAATRTGRRGFGIEIDPVYCDVALDRLSKQTGAQPRLLSGETFDEIQESRSGESTGA